MHRALSLPEVVAGILTASDRSNSFLYTCLFVNRLFFTEAARILWVQCRAGYFREGKYQLPRTRQLAQLANQDTKRAQVYASLVQVLTFNHDQAAEDREARDDTQWLPVLGSLEFPSLRTLEFNSDSELAAQTAASTIIPFLQPNLKSLQLQSLEPPSDDFLKELAARAPRLRDLSFSSEDKSPQNEVLTGDGLAQYLNDAPTLSDLYMDGELGWSSAVFKALADHPSIKSITVPPITEDNWVQDIGLTLGFPGLNELVTTVTDSSLRALLPYLQNLTYLNLNQEILPAQESLLAYVSTLSSLEALQITFPPDAEIHEGHLRRIALGCPNLHTLQLSDATNSDSPCVGIDITDQTIAEVARSLPKLRHFSLCIDPVDLTEEAVIALGRSCRNIEQIGLAANIDFEVLVLQDPETFPILHTWTLILPEEDRPQLSEVENKVLIKQLTTVMPHLHTLWLEGGSDSEQRMALIISS